MDEKDIEVVNGNGNDLNFSRVEDHITELAPKPKGEVKEIVIPEITTNKKSKKKSNTKSKK